jgi:peptidoglycan/LPS O-acetylase OafA/YrhL
VAPFLGGLPQGQGAISRNRGVHGDFALLPIVTEGSHARFYFGTDFRGHALLIGALIGQLYVTGIHHRKIVASRLFQVAVLLASGLLTYWLFALPNREDFLFSGSYTLVALSSALIVCYAAFANPPVLNSKVLGFLGSRSYALYLWHVPINFWLRDLDFWPQVIATLLLSFLAAELSYRLVEHPFQHISVRQRYLNRQLHLGAGTGS